MRSCVRKCKLNFHGRLSDLKYYGMATGTSVLCVQYWGKGDKKTVEKILGLAERISMISSLIFFIISFSMPTTIMRIFTNSPDTIAAGSEYLRVISFSFVFIGFSQVFIQFSAENLVRHSRAGMNVA